MVLSSKKWPATRTTVKETGDRFASMLESVRASDAMATVDWSIAHTPAHVTAIASLYTSMVRPDATPDPLPGLRERWLASPEHRIAVGFRYGYTSTFTLVLDGGRVTVEEPGRAVDVHPRALLTGKLAVWGRRPWLLPAFLRVVHLPS